MYFVTRFFNKGTIEGTSQRHQRFLTKRRVSRNLHSIRSSPMSLLNSQDSSYLQPRFRPSFSSILALGTGAILREFYYSFLSNFFHLRPIKVSRSFFTTLYEYFLYQVSTFFNYYARVFFSFSRSRNESRGRETSIKAFHHRPREMVCTI